MNPKGIETWINTTLNEAETSGIPGTILKPELQVPVYRYGIDRS
jgi:hypothetical protein